MSATAALRETTVLYVSHDMGGGVQRHLEQLTQTLGDRVQVATLLSQPQQYVKLSLGARAWYFHQRDQFQDLLDMLRTIPVVCVHVHHLAGLQPEFWRLAGHLDLSYSLTLHDYSLINGVTTLSDDDGFFLQDIALQKQPQCARLPDWCESLSQWQHMSAQLLDDAETVFCPSEFVREVFLAHYPAANYLPCYHPDWERDAPYPAVSPGPTRDGILRVAVLGMLGREKGADRLEACAIAVRDRELPMEFLLFGQAYRRLHDSVTTLGPYQETQLPALLAEQAIDLVWFPALWAETYSYTLSHCLRQGLAVLAPDVGAFPERLAGRPLSYLFPYRCSSDEIITRLEMIREQVLPMSESLAWQHQAVPDQQAFLYGRDYLAGLSAGASKPALQASEFDRFSKEPFALKFAAFRTRLLGWLLGRGDSRLLAMLQKMVPYGVQKRAKRLLSDKPLHELDR